MSDGDRRGTIATARNVPWTDLITRPARSTSTTRATRPSFDRSLPRSVSRWCGNSRFRRGCSARGERMNRDFTEMLSALSAAGVDYIVVGAHALAVHAEPRATGDLDLWVRMGEDNADRILAALKEFGAPLFDLSKQDLLTPGTVFRIGLPPNRIDLL